MALYTKTGNSNTGTLIILTPKTRDAENKEIDAYFEVKRRGENGNFITADETVKKVSGDIKSLSIKDYEYNDTVTSKVKLVLVDKTADETYLVDMKFNILNRSIFNALLNLEQLNNVSISLYRNKKGYNAAFVAQNEQSVGWKYSLEDLPKPTEIIHPKTNKVISRDFTELDEFYILKLKEWAEKHNIYGAQTDESKNTNNSDDDSLEVQEEATPSASSVEDDDLW